MKNHLNNLFNSLAVKTEDTAEKAYYIGETVAYEKFIIDGWKVYSVYGKTYNDVENFLKYKTPEYLRYHSNLIKKALLSNENKLRKIDVERLKEFIALALLVSLYHDEDNQLEYSYINNEKGDFCYCDFLLQSDAIHDKKTIVSKMNTKDFCSMEIALPDDFTIAEAKKFLIKRKKTFMEK